MLLGQGLFPIYPLTAGLTNKGVAKDVATALALASLVSAAAVSLRKSK